MSDDGDCCFPVTGYTKPAMTDHAQVETVEQLRARVAELEREFVNKDQIIASLADQLAASQARCREMEDDVWKAHVPCTGTQHDPSNGLLHGYCVRCRQEWPCEYSPERHQAQLQATLTAREAQLKEFQSANKALAVRGEHLTSERDAAVQEAGRLREAIRAILHADERGQGLPFKEAMERAFTLVRGEDDIA